MPGTAQLLVVRKGDSDARRVAAELVALGAIAEMRFEGIVEHNGTVLKADVAQRAPKGDGEYSRTIRKTGRYKGRGLAAQVLVYTEEDYGRRLEFGFHGVDALGRTYNQAPQPHWEPAARAARDRLVNDATRAIAELTR